MTEPKSLPAAETSVVSPEQMDEQKYLFEVKSLLRPPSGKQKSRYKVSVGELKRRCGNPERLSGNAILAYLRWGKRTKKEMIKKLIEAGIHPSGSSAETSPCTKITEGEAFEFSRGIGKLASKYIDYKGAASSISMGQNKTEELVRVQQFRETLKELVSSLDANSQDFNLVTHGLGGCLFSLFTNVVDQIMSEKEKLLL